MKYRKEDPTPQEIIEITIGCVTGLFILGLLKRETAEEVLKALGESSGIDKVLKEVTGPHFAAARGPAQ